MEVSSEVLHGLRVAGDSIKIPDKSFGSFIDAVLDSLTDPQRANVEGNTVVSSLNPAVAKLAFSSLSTFLLEAAKHDSDASTLSHILEDCQFAPDRIDVVTGSYTKSKQRLRGVLSQIGTSLPHVVDVGWRVDYYIKNNDINRIGHPMYLLTLKTEKDGHQGEDINLTCSLDQLQDLVGKLRDACKSLERTAQT